MSPAQPNAASSSNFSLIFSNALKAYEKHTKKDLLTHPLASQLQTCDTPAAILLVLQQQVLDLNRSRSNERLTRWLDPTVNVLYASATLGEGVGLVFSPAKAIFAGIGVLLLAVRDVRASHHTLVNIFERIEGFFRRLETYTEVPLTPEMTGITVKIMVEVLSILGIATKEIKQGRTKKYLKKLVGRTDMEDALDRLDKLTDEEARMATAEVLKATHAVDERVRGVDNRVAGVDERVAGIGDRVADVHDRVRAVDEKVAVVIDGQTRQDLHRWLSPSDPSTNHNIACSSHHEGTAEWFFQGSIFKDWKSTGSLLWLHGKPGSGKTIICSAIIRDVLSLCDTGMASIGYFYFDFRDKGKQTRANLLPSLVTQLSAGSDPCCDILSRFYCAHKDGVQKPSEAALIECLKEMVTLPNQNPIYLIIDALDECPNTSGLPSPREQVLDLLQELVDLSLPNLHICVTSRPEIDIRAALGPLTSRRVSLHDQSGQKNDIIDYVTSVVHSDARMRRWREEDKKLVIESLSERADGMFRWVFCQLEALRYCFPPSVRCMLEELPETLDETYERVLREIHKTKQGLAHRLLQCLAVASRPLRVTELAEVLAVDFGTAASGGASKLNTDWRWEDQRQAILSTCSSLITVVDDVGSEVVQFAHFSVKEFLASSRLAISSADVSRFHIPLEPAHTILAKACLGVLLRLDDHADGDTVESSFPWLYMRRNIGWTMRSSGRYRPTYGKGWKISLTRTNHFFRRGSVFMTSMLTFELPLILVFSGQQNSRTSSLLCCPLRVSRPGGIPRHQHGKM
ncbi:hypothetical protein BC826DRAFT_144391 [Russula brevipes]|nr:hypothetical protein BC826DRAFT_144391 [Russula brevipes]